MKIEIIHKGMTVHVELAPLELVYVVERLLNSETFTQLTASEALQQFVKQVLASSEATITEHESGGLEDVERILKPPKEKQNAKTQEKTHKSKERKRKN